MSLRIPSPEAQTLACAGGASMTYTCTSCKAEDLTPDNGFCPLCSRDTLEEGVAVDLQAVEALNRMAA